ncbi:MAG: PIG-L deacetylase family protein, partial [Candidatus Sumerlaeota bacterium]
MTGRRPNILCIEAHPDDIVHGMGGTAWKLKDDYKLHILCLTRGQRGIKGKSAEEAAAIRMPEEQAACELLGGECIFFDEMDGELFAGRELCERVADIIRELKPVAVFSLWPINVADHAAACEVATKAMHLADVFYTTEFYMIENGIGGQTNQFDPDIYVNIDDAIDAKRQLVRCHASQFHSEDHVENTVSRNDFRGKIARCDWA